MIYQKKKEQIHSQYINGGRSVTDWKVCFILGTMIEGKEKMENIWNEHTELIFSHNETSQGDCWSRLFCLFLYMQKVILNITCCSSISIKKI